MIEKGYFKSNSNSLSYVCSIPVAQIADNGIIFVHAANGNRLGPHRMFVEFAKRFNKLGYATMRFDLTGCGDSTGSVAEKNMAPNINDLGSAIHFFHKHCNVKKIFLLGISRGARLIFSAAAENCLPISGAILLSAPAHSQYAASKAFLNRLKEYLYKFKNPNSLKKLLTGKANFGQILKTLSFALGYQRRYSRHTTSIFKTRCPLLFIYAGNDPIAADSQLAYKKTCQKFKIPHKFIEIENANHSFFHYKWKEQISEHIERWLTKTIS